MTEIVAGFPIMGSFHGSYSLAAACGSLLGGALAVSGLSTALVFGVFGGMSLFVTGGFSVVIIIVQ